MILDDRIDKYLRVFDGSEVKYIFILNESKTMDEGEDIWSTFAGRSRTTEEMREWAKNNGFQIQIGMRAKPSEKNTIGYWES